MAKNNREARRAKEQQNQLAQLKKEIEELKQPQQAKENKPTSFKNYGAASTKTSFVIQRDFSEEITTVRAKKASSLKVIGFNIVNGKNKFLNQIIGSEQYSTTFGAVHSSLMNYSFAGGFSYKANLSEEAKKFYQEIPQEGVNQESFLDICQKAGVDLHLFGNAYILMRIGKSGTVYPSNLKIYQCRPVKNDELGKPTHVAISPHFEEDKTTGIADEELKVLPIYPAMEEEVVGGVSYQSCVIHIKNYYPTHSYWGMPTWKSALLWMEIEYRVARFNISEFENGFTPSAIVVIKGSLSPEEQTAMEKNFEESFLNTGNNAKLFTMFQGDGADVQILDSRKEGQFLEIMNMAEQQILKSTQFTPSMAGIKTAGQLGSNQQLQDEYELVSTNVVRPFQKKIYNNLVVPFLKLSKKEGEVLGFNQTPPISLRSQININEIMTIQEKRAMLGLPPATEDQLAELNGTPTIQ